MNSPHLADSTVAEYAQMLFRFMSWLNEHGLTATPVPPETVAQYVRSLSGGGMSIATIAKTVSAINDKYSQLGLPVPGRHSAVVAALREIRGAPDFGMIARKLARLPPEKFSEIEQLIANAIGATNARESAKEE